MDLTSAINGIIKYRTELHVKQLWNSPGDLSEVMLKLATYNSYLADHIAGAHKAATDKAYAVFTEATSNDTSVTKAEAMARGESVEERHAYENVQNIYKATANLISVIQSRLRVIESQMRQEGKS